MNDEGRVVSASVKRDDRDNIALRPKRLDSMVGQDALRDNLSVILDAAKLRKEPIDHLLFYGPPVLG